MLVKWIAKQFSKPEGFGGKLATWSMNIGNHALYQSVKSQIPNRKDIMILDVGYGNGYLLKKLLKQGYLHVFGLEISESMQTNVQRKLKREIREQKCQLTLGKLENFEVTQDLFDVVYSINTLYFWESLPVGLSKLYEISKSDGVVLLACYEKRLLEKLPSTKYGFQLYETKEIERQCLENGFLIKKVIKTGYQQGLCYVLIKK